MSFLWAFGNKGSSQGLLSPCVQAGQRPSMAGSGEWWERRRKCSEQPVPVLPPPSAWRGSAAP